MPTALEELARPVLIGRSSSHFTRVTRIFAEKVSKESFWHLASYESSDTLPGFPLPPRAVQIV